MSHPSFIPTRDPRVRAALETELALAAKTPGLGPLLRHEPDLWPRFAGYYQHLCHLPRRVRRALARRWRRSLPAIALLLALGQAPALAATLPVAPGIPPDIVNDGLCALIEAIENANADAATHDDCLAGSGADTIVLPSASTQLLTAVDNTTDGDTGLPVITSKITIEGKGSTIVRERSAPEFRILAVGSDGDLKLNRTTVSGGDAGNSAYYGGGVFNSGTLTLTNSTVSNNGAYSVGGVFNSGTLTLTNSTISGNNGAFHAGGVYNNNGIVTLTNSTVSDNNSFFGAAGIVNSGTATLINSTVSDNSSDNGIGGVTNSGALTLTNSTISGNSSEESGGVVNGGTLTLTNSTVSGNNAVYRVGGVVNGGTLTLTHSTVSGNGSALYVGGMQNLGTATLISSTISGNNGGFPAGGVLNEGTLTLTNSTVSGNSGFGPGGVTNSGTLTLTNSTVSGNYGYNGGGVGNSGTLTLARTLVSGNTGPDGPEIFNYSGSIVAADNFNLFGHDGNAGVEGFSRGLTDIVPSEPLSAILDPLADNGGPTQTHALLAGSPAIDTSPVDSDCPPIDQRGVSRPQGAACDIGALEQGPPLRCDGKIVRILGTVGNDNLIGTPGPDVLHGLGGRDVIHGLAGNDILCGGTHRDNLFGGRGADRLDGGAQTDNCNGGAGTGDTAVNCETVSGVP